LVYFTLFSLILYKKKNYSPRLHRYLVLLALFALLLCLIGYIYPYLQITITYFYNGFSLLMDCIVKMNGLPNANSSTNQGSGSGPGPSGNNGPGGNHGPGSNTTSGHAVRGNTDDYQAY
jgi:hypothetical protein